MRLPGVPDQGYNAESRSWLLSNAAEFSFMNLGSLDLAFPFLLVGVHCLYRCQFQVPAENRSPFCDLDVARSLRKKFGIALGKGATVEARKLSKKTGVELASRIAN